MADRDNEMESDIRARVVNLEHSAAAKEQRIAALETWQRQKDIQTARDGERWSAMESRIDNRFSGLEESVRDIKTTLSRINWLVIGGIITGVVAFIIRGGLVV